MRVRDLLVETGSALDANRGRSLLTILGIVIGIGAVIAMTALIGGVRQTLMGELGLNQARMVYMYCYPDRAVTLDDLHNFEELLPQYERLTASSFTSADATSNTKSTSCSVIGVLPSYFEVMGLKVKEGRLIGDEDYNAGALVAVVDEAFVRELFGNPNEEVVGRNVYLNNVAYRIVGVLEAGTSYMGGSGTAYLPFSTCAVRLTGDWSISDISGLAAEDANMDTLAAETIQVLQKYFRMNDEEAEESIYVQTMQEIIDEVETTMLTFQLMMTAVASVSLLVGGIGIMNMMLTNVTARIREIGLRKALGARRSDITRQFLLESICLCLAGGVIGIAVGYLGARALTGVVGGMLEVGSESAPLVPVIDVQSVAIATGICVLIGVLFGYYPARRAASLDPIESLHYQ